MRWITGWGARSNEGSVANARAATTVLSRLRVEREETELFLRQKYAARATVGAVADVRSVGGGR